MKCFECLLKGRDIVAVLPTGFGKSLLFQLLPDFVPVNEAGNNIDSIAYTTSTVRDIYTFAVFCSVTRPFFVSLVFMKGTSCCVLRS